MALSLLLSYFVVRLAVAQAIGDVPGRLSWRITSQTFQPRSLRFSDRAPGRRTGRPSPTSASRPSSPDSARAPQLVVDEALPFLGDRVPGGGHRR
jgi:hypothetical protein